jgi:hypothetical protein
MLNDHYLAATHEGVSLTSSTIAKTDRRFASETSLRCCASLMACIAYNHFIEVDGDTEVNVKLGEGEQQFVNLLKDVSDVPFIRIRKFQDPSFKYIYPKKGMLNDAKDSVIDA